MAHVHTPSPPLPGFADIFEQRRFEPPFQNAGFLANISSSPTENWNPHGGYFNPGQSRFQQRSTSPAGLAINHMPIGPPIEAPASAFQPSSYSMPRPETAQDSVQYHDLLDRIEEEQEELRDARDELVGSRYRLRTKRQELSAARMNTVTQAGAGIDLLKRYLLQNNIALPEQIDKILSEVDQLRDSLGKLEVEYEETEEKYTLEEWRYTQKESKFVENLNTDTPLGNSITKPLVSTLRRDAPQQPFSDSTDNRTTADVLSQLTSTPQNHQIVQASSNVSDMPRSIEAVYPSVPVRRDPMPVSHYMEHAYPLSKHNIERNLPLQRLGWSNTFIFINDWLWQTLKGSSLERKRLNGMIKKDGLSNEDKWKLAEKLWNSDVPEGDLFLAGYTAKSPEATSETTSVSPMTKLFENPAFERSDVQATSALQLLPQERVVDALEPVEFPQTIEPKDLVEVVPERVLPTDRCPTGFSMSTQPTTVTNTSSGVGGTTSHLEATDSLTSSENPYTIRQDEFSDRGLSSSDCLNYDMQHNAGDATLAPSKMQSYVREPVNTVHEPSMEPVDNSQHSNLSRDQLTNSFNTDEPYSSDHERYFQTIDFKSNEQATTAFPVDLRNAHYASTEDTSSPTATKPRTLPISAPITRINSPYRSERALHRQASCPETQCHLERNHTSPTPLEPLGAQPYSPAFVPFEYFLSQCPGNPNLSVHSPNNIHI